MILKFLISDNFPEVVNFDLKCLIISNFFGTTYLI